MLEAITINGAEVPFKYHPIILALLTGLDRVDRDKTTGELILRCVLQSGGVRDKYLTVTGKIG